MKWDMRLCRSPYVLSLPSLRIRSVVKVGVSNRNGARDIVCGDVGFRDKRKEFDDEGSIEEASKAMLELPERPALRFQSQSPLRSALNQRALANISILLAYSGASMMICSMGPVLGAMISDASLGITGAHTGSICACGNFGAVVGKAFSAGMVLSLTPKYCYMLTLAATAVAMGVMAVGTAPMWFAACFTVSKFFFASTWVSATQLLRKLHPMERHGAALGGLALSSRVGLMLVTALSGFLLYHGTSWRMILLWTAGIGTCAAYLVGQFVITSESRIMLSGNVHEHHTLKSSHPDTFSEFLQRFSKVRLMLVTRCLLQATMELQMFIVLFGQGFHAISTAGASQLLMSFSCGAATSVILSGHLYCVLNDWQRRLFIVICCVVASCSLFLLSISQSPLHSCFLFATLGITLAPPFYIAIPGFNLKFGGDKSAILEGGSEMVTMMVSIVVDCLIGGWVAKFGLRGWSILLKALSFVMLLGAICQYAFLGPDTAREERLAHL